MFTRRSGVAVVTASSIALAVALHACSLVDPIDGLTGNDDSGADGPTEAEAPRPTEAEAPRPCVESPYEGELPITEGFVCGVGPCSKRLGGAECRIETLLDGGLAHPCTNVYPTEVAGNGLDDDCDGTLDEGHSSAAPDAGLRCHGCAFGASVQRLADGTIETAGSPNNRKVQRNTTACINSLLCRFGTPTWTRNVSMISCTLYCNSIGGTCKPACATSSPSCTGAGIGTNLGTYSDDYKCVVPPGHPNNPNAGAPLTGGCDATFPYVSEPSADFNYYCCCQL